MMNRTLRPLGVVMALSAGAHWSKPTNRAEPIIPKDL
jgi:hypothetical protein